MKPSRSVVIRNTMAASARAQVISLYRTMLRESSKFPSYNYRTYAMRRVRDAFRANRKVEDPKAVERLVEEGQQMLALIQRQVSIGKMFETQKIVVE
ncbi:LYR motif-containing protein 4 [Xiphias gladius]|uniref:LYR motif-containing protein 4 n=1 Tax=Xiphias gladius TaxID=8245 RepID=UPI001A98D9AF|nr:LYR motif-containing protein 4 [Xiphias gladius]